MKLESIYMEQKAKAELVKVWADIRMELVLLLLSRVVPKEELQSELNFAVEYFMSLQKGVDKDSKEFTQKVAQGVKNELMGRIDGLYGGQKHEKKFTFELPVERFAIDRE